MDCQGAQVEPEGRPGGPGDLKTATGHPPLLLHLSLVLLAFLLALPGIPDNPSSYPYLEPFEGLSWTLENPFKGLYRAL